MSYENATINHHNLIKKEKDIYLKALKQILSDGVELSHEKVLNQRDYFIKVALTSLNEADKLWDERI